MIISNVNLVLPNEVVRGSVEVENGTIRAIQPGASTQLGTLDGQGGYLIPGLIELHTDNLDKYFMPRPKVNWPPFSAMAAHDAQLVGAGITTVLDAVAVGDVRDGGTRQDNLDRMINTIIDSEKRGVNRAEHLLHLRCELPHETTVPLFENYLQLEQLQLVSLMDHSPGQRQFVNLQKYREYYQGKYGLTDSELAEFEADQRSQSERWSDSNRAAIARMCRNQKIPLASHDDATAAHVEESKALGLVIAEFPTTVEAAKRSHELGLMVMMGAPNVVRGGSHSGNVAAHELASLGVLDVLSSDYFPGSLLDAAFKLADDERNGLTLVDTIKMTSTHSAQALGLDDRGSIEVGKQADLVLVQSAHGQAYVQQVWRKGVRVF